MNSIFVYDFVRKSKGGKNTRAAVIFCADANPEFRTSADEIKSFFDKAIPPDEIYLMVSGSLDPSKMSEVAADKKLADALPNREQGVLLLTFDRHGQLFLQPYLGEGEAEPLGDVLAEMIRTEGLRTIFRERHGILEASTTHHYAKPSGKHCNQFIRAGNVLNTSSEINFIAFCLLRFIHEETTHLYCDTSSINAAAYAVSYLLSRFNGDRSKSEFIIDSFGSYEGLKTFPFHSVATSVILISASTSGDLVEKILTKSLIDRSRIVTLFYLGTKSSEGQVLCDLLRSDKNPGGFGPIKSEPAEDCALCRQGSVCVKIVGDQFLPENPNVTDYLVKATDVPAWLNDFLNQFKGKEIIKCYYDNQGIPARSTLRMREIFLDVAPAYEKNLEGLEHFMARWTKTLAQTVPSSLRRIIYLDDEASQALAESVRNHFTESNYTRSEEVIWKSAREIRTPDASDDKEGATVVVCGCMCTGRKLMGVSQSLRNINTGGAITFLIGISRTPDTVAFGEIRSNLTYGDVASDYGLYCVETIQCRDNPSHLDTSWDEEEKLLKTWQQQLDGSATDESAGQWIQSRLAVLGRVGTSRGLYTNVFWPSPQGRELLLRRNMAFVKFNYNAGGIAQSEVYFAICSILHRLRDVNQKGAALQSSPLIQHEHHRVLLAPACFYRFNDGAIQAAFLRAANRAELDYKISPERSEQMREVVSQILENWDNDRGEACGEFLLALATEKLQLAAKDTRQLVEDFCSTEGVPPHLKSLSHFIGRKFSSSNQKS